MHQRDDKGPNFFVIGLAAAVLVALIAVSCRKNEILSALAGG